MIPKCVSTYAFKVCVVLCLVAFYNSRTVSAADFEENFEAILYEKYEEATPRLEDLEEDVLLHQRLTYGGATWQWFSTAAVWKDGDKIVVRAALTPEQAADAYYNFLKNLAQPTDEISKGIRAFKDNVIELERETGGDP